jgi:hypothetical protein
VEREDFGSGTSSKSTKLVHGGVRYLEKAGACALGGPAWAVPFRCLACLLCVAAVGANIG